MSRFCASSLRAAVALTTCSIVALSGCFTTIRTMDAGDASDVSDVAVQNDLGVVADADAAPRADQIDVQSMGDADVVAPDAIEVDDRVVLDIPTDVPSDSATDVPSDVPSDVPDPCPMAQPTRCGASCVNTTSDNNHCGACGMVCAVPANAQAACTMGACGLGMCRVGFGNCDMMAANGCETNTNTDMNHCGGCGQICRSPANGVANCAMGVCAVTCDAGFQRVGSACLPQDTKPRLLAPMSLGDTTQRRPTLRWEFPPAVNGIVYDGASVDLCLDRACSMIIETIIARGNTARPTMDLPGRRAIFWRVRGRIGAAESVVNSTTWLFHTPAVSASTMVDTSVSPHLDVNGDGFDDLAVGAPNADPRGLVNAGAFYLYHGGAGAMDDVPRTIVNGTSAGQELGYSVASVGDLNGDGFADVAAGSRFANGGAGSLQIHFGSPMGISASPSVTLNSPAVEGEFGTRISSAGDINADGYADLLVSAPRMDIAPSFDLGAVYVYNGRAGGLIANPPTARLTGSPTDLYFGRSLAGGADFDGDGFSDLILGHPDADPNAIPDSGTVTITFGSAVGPAIARNLVIAGTGRDDKLGIAVSFGDTNNDGYSDLAVGIPLANPGGVIDAGSVQIHQGSAAGLNAMAQLTLNGPSPVFILGASVSMGGDVTGDGYDDLVAGAYLASPGGRANAGVALVYAGSAMGLNNMPLVQHEGVAATEHFGFAVTSLGDLNADGFADVVVSATEADPGGRTDAGSVRIFRGNAMGGTLTMPVLDGVGAGDAFGYTLAQRWPRQPRRNRWDAMLRTLDRRQRL